MRKYSYGFLFIISGAFFLAVGIILHHNEYQLACTFLLSIGATVIAVVLVNFLWSKSGGEPLQQIIEEMRGASELFSDALETGLRRVQPIRSINYQEQHNLVSTAKSVSILSLIFNVVRSRELKKSLKRCVENGGRIRILLLSPNTNDNTPSPLKLRQYAESDFTNRIPNQVQDTLEFLRTIKKDIKINKSGKEAYFEFKVISNYVIYYSMTCIDDRVQVSHYSNNRRGVDSPTMLIENVASPNSLYKVYMEEFEYLWDKAELVI